MPQATYNGVTLEVEVPSTGGSVITMDALEDFYEPWKDFLRQGAVAGQMANKKFPQCWRPIAGDPITPTANYTGMIFLQNQKGWRFRLPDENVTLIVTGNLTLQDTTLPFFNARAGKTGSILGLAEYSTTVATGSGVLPQDIIDIAVAVWDEILIGATHNINTSAGRRLRQLQEAGGYAGSIWIDTIDGTAGTTNFENGADTLPSLTLADANTLAAALNLERFEIAPGSSLTFAAAQENQGFTGDGWTLALGGQSIAGSTFRGADVSGIGTGESHEFHDCHFGVCTLGGGKFKNCGLEDTVTLSGAVVYSFIDCYHNEAGAPSTIDFDAGGATEVHIHNWHGNLTILNMGAGDILHFTSADGSLTMDASCIGGTRNSAGTFGLTDNSTGMTINDLGQAYQPLMEIFKLLGLQVGDKITITPTGIISESGDIDIDFTGDGVLSTTSDRQ